MMEDKMGFFDKFKKTKTEDDGYITLGEMEKEQQREKMRAAFSKAKEGARQAGYGLLSIGKATARGAYNTGVALGKGAKKASAFAQKFEQPRGKKTKSSGLGGWSLGQGGMNSDLGLSVDLYGERPKPRKKAHKGRKVILYIK